MKLQIPDAARQIINALTQNGFEAYVVGGCVRDALLGITPHDWDICTNASPQQMQRCFEGWKTIEIGIQHGTIAVVMNGEVYEVTAYRVDGTYSDNRHPDTVRFTSELSEDLARRDFTVNAMAYSDSDGLIDLYCGSQDLRDGIIRCVGDPDKRFNEDALRILRAMRFASRFGFAVERKTAESIRQNAPLLNNIAAERIREEFGGILTGKSAEAILNEYREVIAVFIPEIKPCFDFDQCTKHHCYDVYRHITHSVGQITPTGLLRTVMFFHDIGKPQVMTQDADGTRHFKGHQLVSADIAHDVLRRLRCPNAFIDDCVKLIIYHDVRFSGSKKLVKRVMNAIGADNMPLLFEVMTADYLSQSDYNRDQKRDAVETAKAQYAEIIADHECFSFKELKINRKDLIGIGITDGKKIGATLNALLNEVIDETLPNEKNALLQRAGQINIL